MANMPEEMTEENVAEEAVVSQVSGSKSARDVSGSSCQDRGPGEVMEYMVTRIWIKMSSHGTNVMEKMEFS